MRITILGNSGSGKSTLARWLADRAGVPLLDLDTIFWAVGETAARRPQADATADLLDFCAASGWIIEGCYADLAEASLPFRPRLVFLNPGLETCVANCGARPWEPHKYPTKDAQDERLPFLLEWVSDYYKRSGPMSLRAHRACFDAYTGPKIEFTRQPQLSPADPSLPGLLD